MTYTIVYLESFSNYLSPVTMVSSFTCLGPVDGTPGRPTVPLSYLSLCRFEIRHESLSLRTSQVVSPEGPLPGRQSSQGPPSCPVPAPSMLPSHLCGFPDPISQASLPISSSSTSMVPVRSSRSRDLKSLSQPSSPRLLTDLPLSKPL